MKYLLTLLLICISLNGTTHAQAVSRQIANPQLSMVGARHQSLGVTNPAIPGDTNGLFINPAAIGYLDTMPLAISNQHLLGMYDVYAVHLTYPTVIKIPFEDRKISQKVGFGLSFGSNTSSRIPETILENGAIRQVDSYSAGFNIFQLTAGTEFLDIYGFNNLSLGGSLKGIQQTIASDTRLGYALDVGALATYYMEKHPYIDRVHVGFSILNFISTRLTWDNDRGESTLPFEAFAGARVDALDERLSLYMNNGIEGLMTGAEFTPHNNLIFRGSTNLSFDQLNVGIGIILENIAGLNSNRYSTRVDMNYTQNTGILSDFPQYTLALSILGESKPKTPLITTPKSNLTIPNRAADLKGTGPKNTTIRIYNNDTLTRTVSTDKYGNWFFNDYPLREGENNIHIQAYSIDKDLSTKSNIVSITSDTEPANISLMAYPDLDSLIIEVVSQEPLNNVKGSIGKTNLKFEQETDLIWKSSIDLPEQFAENTPVPDKMAMLKIVAEDEAGNKTPELTKPFFATLEYPTDKTVHYNNTIRFLGKSSELTKEIDINGQKVLVDKGQNFALETVLTPGKNMVNVHVKTLNDSVITHSLRILYLKSFPDITGTGFNAIKERREIEFLATLGVIDGDLDKKFYPNKNVTRRYLAKLMVNILGYEVADVDYALFSDVKKDDPDAGAIEAALENGLIFAFPDGTFKPDQPLTLSEAIFLLNNAGIIDEEPTTLIDNNFITRKELAQFLAYTPLYELQIERLIDWEKGYN